MGGSYTDGQGEQRIHRRKKALWITLSILMLLFIALVFSQLIITEMGSSSMEPLISGQGLPPSKRGDLVVVSRWVRSSSLRSGDLVLAEIPTPSGKVSTIRRIEQQPDTPVGQYYLRATAESGIDSRHFGPLPSQDIKGRVVWILR